MYSVNYFDMYSGFGSNFNNAENFHRLLRNKDYRYVVILLEGICFVLKLLPIDDRIIGYSWNSTKFEFSLIRSEITVASINQFLKDMMVKLWKCYLYNEQEFQEFLPTLGDEAKAAWVVMMIANPIGDGTKKDKDPVYFGNTASTTAAYSNTMNSVIDSLAMDLAKDIDQTMINEMMNAVGIPAPLMIKPKDITSSTIS